MHRDGTLPDCPVELTLHFMGDPWTVLILRELIPGTRRFGELRKGVAGITQKVLAAHLRTMEENALLVRKAYAEVPPRVEYTLTPLGQSLGTVVNAMAAWGKHYQQSRCRPSVPTHLL